MFFSIIALVSGIVIAQQLSVLPDIYWLVILLVIVTVLFFFRLWRLMFFTMGLLWAICFASIRLSDRLPESLEGKYIQIEGHVIGLPQRNERRVRFDFAVLKSPYPLPKKIRLNWFFPKQEIKAGQYWKLTVKLKKPHGQLNPGGFDYERWLFIHTIGATGYVRNNPPPKLTATMPVWQNFTTIRQWVSEQITTLLPNSENVGVIKALTIGDRQEITDKQWEIFRKTGTVHLIAISGLHIGLIAGLAYLLMLKIAIKLSSISPQKIAAITAMLVAVFYSALAGFSLPTQRALIMLLIVMLAQFIQRHSLVKNTLALAMLGVVILDPLAVLSAGFWLSFLAVSVIVYSFSGRLAKTTSWLGMSKVHYVTALGLSPLLVFYFQQVSLIAPLANFIVVPVVSLLLVPMCLVAVILLLISDDLAYLILLLIDQMLQALWFVLSMLVEIPYAVLPLVSPPFYTIPFALLGMLIFLSPQGIPARWLGSVLLLPLLFVKQDKLAIAEVEMTLLDVGQGLSAIVRTRNHVLVFDTGAKYSEQFDMGNSVVIPFLQYKGEAEVDSLIISHGDNDHIGGAESIIKQLNVKKVLTSVPELLMQYQPKQCNAGMQWSWDEVKFEIISPVPGIFTGENNNSCVLKISTLYKSILLTGDIEKQAENWLVKQQGARLKSDVLVAAHHGSKTSSTKEFLTAVNPNMILIPAGYKNRFSFPHDEVINRYVELNKNWMNTATEGAIKVKLIKQKLTITTERTESGRYWN